MFAKSLKDIVELDIQALVDNEEQESATLEFKQKLDSTGEEKSIKDVKKELVKDVSAMANANGGLIIYGIKEEGGKAKEVVGIEEEMNGRPVKEWVEQVLISNVRPRLAFRPQVVNLENDGKIVLVLQVSRIPYRPHMVLDGNVYYVRNNSGVALADEHEVRAMVLESKSSSDEVKEFLKKRNLDDKDKENFALTPLSKIIRENPHMVKQIPEGHEGKPFVLFASCPRHLEERVDIASGNFSKAVNQSGDFRLLGYNINFFQLTRQQRITSDSLYRISYDDDGESKIRRYVEICRNGYVERGLCNDVMWSSNINIMWDNQNKDGVLLFHISKLAADFWAYMKFISQLYGKIGYFDELNIIIALSDTKGVVAHGFRGYTYDHRHGRSRNAQEKNVLIERSVIISELRDEKIEAIVKEVVGRVFNHFNERTNRCLNEEGKFYEEPLKECIRQMY